MTRIKKEMYNTAKLTPIFETMEKKKVLVIGGGAIGSIICEALTRNGTGYIAVCDKDFYEEDNLPKSSFVIRYPEDINISKAHALANRLGALTKDGCKIKGFNIDLKKIGPLALAGFDYVVLALDTVAMRIFAQKLIKMCPEKRPILLSCGTTHENSEALFISPKGACLRCTIPDAWLVSENPETIHSCAAKVNYLLPQKHLPIVSTSGIPSMKSAIDIDDMITAHATGAKSFTKSERYIQVPYPEKSGHSTTIGKLNNCPVCSIKAPENINYINGSTYHLTLRDFLNTVRGQFDGPCRLKVHMLEIPGVPDQVYDQFVINEACKVCGKNFRLLKHSGDIREQQIICPECEKFESSDETIYNPERNITETRYFSLEETEDDVLDLTLLELGYPIGCYYEVEGYDNNPSCECECDLFSADASALVSSSETKTFALSEDRDFLMDK